MSWSKRRSSNSKTVEVEEECDAWTNEFQGLDLDEWMYLGFTELQLDSKPYILHMFCQYEDHSKRAVRIQGTEHSIKLIQDYHTYYQKYTQPWSMGDGEIYFYVTNPSRFLKQYMLDTWAHEWDRETKWWIPSDNAKYRSAQSRQTRTEKKEVAVTETEENVVKVDFTRGKNDEG